MTALRNGSMGLFIALAIVGAWIYGWNRGYGAHPVRQLPSPCFYPQAPYGVKPSGTPMRFQGLNWTCSNGVWTTDGVMK